MNTLYVPKVPCNMLNVMYAGCINYLRGIFNFNFNLKIYPGRVSTTVNIFTLTFNFYTTFTFWLFTFFFLQFIINYNAYHDVDF